MDRKTGKRLLSLFLALTLCFGCLSFLSPTADAASMTVYLIDYPRLWDASTAGWGHPDLHFMGGYFKEGHNHGWTFIMSGSYYGPFVYCLEPGVAIYSGDSLSDRGEDYWDNYPADYNQTISPAQIKGFIGRILQYGYQGNGSDSWSIHNAEQANALASEMATQILIWETVAGERDADFNHVDASAYGKNNMTELISGSHPLRTQIFNAYNDIAKKVQQHSKVPSFMASSSGVPGYELSWNGSDYAITLTDTNGVLSSYRFTGSVPGMEFSVSGNDLTIRMAAAPTVPVTVTANKEGGTRTGVVIWSDGNYHGGTQDIVTYGAAVTDSITASMTLEVKAGNLQIVKTSEDDVVEGIGFHITGNGIGTTLTTGAGGTIDLPGINPGVYTVTELISSRYIQPEAQEVTIVSGQTATVYFNNTLKRGDLTVTKTAEDALVEGITFHLYGTSDAGIPVDEYAVTDASGTAAFRNVLIGSGYTLEEYGTPYRYVVPDAQSACVEWNTVTSRSFHNTLKKFSVTVTKADLETGHAQGNASLAGAVYGLYNGDELMATYTTDANGQFTTDYFPCGENWYLREISPSEGYLLDPTAYPIPMDTTSFTVEKNGLACSVAETVIRGSISIVKHADNGDTQIETPEEGAQFVVYRKNAGGYENAAESEKDYLVCDENGYAQTKSLPYGTYTVEQIRGWDGVDMIAPFDVQISQNGQVYRYIINDAVRQAYIRIVKKDAESGSVIPSTGCAFQIYDPQGQLVTMSVTYPEAATLDTFYTGTDGQLITPHRLPYGTGYSLVEVQAPLGYVVNSDPVYFDITEDSSSEEGGIVIVSVEKADMPQKGIIRVEKTGEMFTSVQSNGEMYVPVFAAHGLSGAVFEISAAEDIVTPDGTIHYTAGQVVDTVTTGEDGSAVSKELYLGQYTIRETAAPAGMVLNTEVKTVELQYAGQEVAVTEAMTSLTNQRQKASLSLRKELETDAVFGYTGQSGVTSATFGLYAAETLTALDGSSIPADGLLEIAAAQEDGSVRFTADIPFGQYYVKEIGAPLAYLPDGTAYPLIFAPADEATALVTLTVNKGNALVNTLRRGHIQGIKYGEGHIPLPGAVIGLYPENGSAALMQTTSGEDGRFSFDSIPYGHYEIREIQSPEGYILSDTVYPVSVDADGAIVTVEMTNARIRGTVQLTKVDEDYPDHKLSGAVFEVYADTDGDGALTANDTLLGEMTELTGGIYTMPDLPYGVYLVREKTAPAGFLLDETAYPFSITENGKTVVVENKAGVGLMNKAQTGSLRILKTADGKTLSGFSFTVMGTDITGQHYKQTFVTNEKGEIRIDGLRPGQYTISENSNVATTGYILADPVTATVEAGRTSDVKIHNRLKPVTPDIPKTGDRTHTQLWRSLFYVSLTGTAVSVWFTFRRRKEDE